MPEMTDLLASSPLTFGTVKAASVEIRPQPGRDRSSGTWTLFLAYDDCPALHDFFVGGPVTDPDTEETAYNPPQELPGWPELIYSGADVEGITGADGKVMDETGKILYKYATFVARFESRQWGFDGDNQKGLPRMTGGVEIFTPEAGTMVWQDGGQMDGQPPIVVPVFNISVPIYNQANINWAVITNAQVNPLNSLPMPIFGGVAAKRVRYDGPDVSWRLVRPKPVCDLIHHFSIRAVPWDQELRFKAGTPPTSTFTTYKRANGDPAIGTSNLNLLVS